MPLNCLKINASVLKQVTYLHNTLFYHGTKAHSNVTVDSFENASERTLFGIVD
jgi:hypothetical protein